MNDLRINRNLARWILLGVGVVALVVMAVALVVTPMHTFNTVSYVALGVGILGIAGFVLLDPQSLVTSITGRTSQYGTTTVLMSLFFIVFVVAIYIIVKEFKISPWDLTEGQKYQLSQPSIDVLSNLKDDIHVIGFYTDAGQREEAEIWLREYEKRSNGKLTYEFIDPDRDPGMAQRLEMTRSGVMVFSRGEDFTAEAAAADERSMTGALVSVMSGEARKLYMVTGHGERSADGFETTDFSQFKSQLTQIGFEIETLNLIEKGSVPEDAALVVIAGPTAQISASEIEALKAYTDAGGAALIMLDPMIGGGQLVGNGVMGVAFNSDGSQLATASADGVIRLWKVSTFQPISEMRGHTSDVADVAFSPDGKQIVSAGLDGTVRVWNVSTGEQVQQLEGQTQGVRRVMYSPDGRLLASVSTNQILNVWNARTFEPLDYSPISVPTPLFTIAFSPDSSLIAAGGGLDATSGTTYVWDAKDGEEVLNKTLHTDIVFDMAFSPDGETLHSVAVDGTTGSIDVASGEGNTETLYPSIGISGLAIAEDGTELYSLLDGSVHMHPADTTSTDEDVILSGHTDMIWAMQLSPDGDTLATGSRDGTARLWDLTVSPPTSRETSKTQGGGDPLLNYLRDSWGIQADDNFIVDSMAPQDISQPVVYTFDQTSPIVQSLNSIVIFTLARSIQPAETLPQGITVTPLLFSSAEQNGQIASWGETELTGNQYQPSFEPDKDLPGPLPMGVSAENTATAARIVVYGDADVASDAWIGQYSNSILMSNTANWLTESEDMLNIPIKDIGTHTMDQPFSPLGLNIVSITSVCLIPTLGMIAGAVVFFVRRRRR